MTIVCGMPDKSKLPLSVSVYCHMLGWFQSHLYQHFQTGTCTQILTVRDFRVLHLAALKYIKLLST